MPTTKEQSFLDRAKEAFAERYPRTKPTQERLARFAGVTQPAVHLWGLPGRAPEHPVVLKLALDLGVCVEWLYTGRGPKRPQQAGQSVDPFLQVWNDMPAETKRQLERYAEFIKNDTHRQ